MRELLEGGADANEAEVARVAAVYVERCRDPSTARAPVKATAEEEEMPRARIRDLLHAARGRDLLTAGGRGTAGGSLTEKAVRLLNRQGDVRNGRMRPRPVSRRVHFACVGTPSRSKDTGNQRRRI